MPLSVVVLKDDAVTLEANVAAPAVFILNLSVLFVISFKSLFVSVPIAPAVSPTVCDCIFVII